MSPRLTDRLSDDTVEEFQRNGVVMLRQVFNTDELSLINAGIKVDMASPGRLRREYGSEGRNGFFYDAFLVPDVRELETFALESPMAEIAARLMCSNTASVFYFTVFVRSPGCATQTPWHRDQTGWCAQGDQTLSIWTSLDHVPRNSALEFVLGSHLWDVRFKRKSFDANGLGIERDVAGLEDAVSVPDLFGEDRHKHDIVGWEMEPGDCLVFHTKTLHGGSGNLPEGLGRHTLSTQWVGDNARVEQPPGGSDPDWIDSLERHGIKPGDHPASVICPRVWPPELATCLPWRQRNYNKLSAA